MGESPHTGKRVRTGNALVDPDGRIEVAGRHVELRPKSRLLLRRLIEHPEIQSKEQLIDVVWRHTEVDDQALFQLISEIRQAFGDRQCIATFPNRGYRWSWPIKPAGQSWLKPAVGAAFVIALTAAALLFFWSRPEPRSETTALLYPPAITALNQALEARAEGRLERAVGLLELALAENPHFALAKLELAQTLAVMDRSDAAIQIGHEALSDARIVGDRYMEVSALVVLSRLSWVHGDLGAAQAFSAAAGDVAREQGFVCASQLTEDWSRRLGAAMLGAEEEQEFGLSMSSLAACRAQLDGELRQLLRDSQGAVTGRPESEFG